ncbi:MAG: FHA domain-containing protein [Steroidobacteraceae bacterium]|jgi:chromosome segregation ATPase
MKKLQDHDNETSPEELQRTAVMPGLTDLEATATDVSETDTWVAPPSEGEAAREALIAAEASRDAALAARENLEQTVHALTVRLGELEARVQGRSEELHEYERQLNVRDRHISELQDQAGALSVQLSAARTEQRELLVRAERGAAELRALEARLQEAPSAMASAPTLLPPVKRAVAADELQVRAERYLESLRTLEARRQIFDDMLHDAEIRVRERDVQIANLEQQLNTAFTTAGADRRRIAKLDSMVDDLQHQLAEANGRAQLAEQHALELQGELTPAPASAATPPAPEAAPMVPAAELAAANERITVLEQELSDHGEMIRLVHGKLSTAQADLEATQRRLQEAQAQKDTLESHLRLRTRAPDSSAADEAALRAEIERLAGALQEREQVVQRLQAEARRRNAPGSPLLVRRSGATNIAHVLTGRTTIGRTPDNSIQIDTPSVSRHHAVLLLTHEGTVVEDLASTNGVYINGTRVRRQALREGDLLTVGNTEFRFVFKPGA